jgi:predicted thioesterase
VTDPEIGAVGTAFDVIAHDPGGEIGRGTHKRAIISRERLLAGAAKRR